ARHFAARTGITFVISLSQPVPMESAGPIDAAQRRIDVQQCADGISCLRTQAPHCGRLPNVPGAAQTRGDTGHMNEYEMVLLVHQDVSKDDRTKILDKARDTIKSGGGTWVEDADWGRRELAYDIDH